MYQLVNKMLIQKTLFLVALSIGISFGLSVNAAEYTKESFREIEYYYVAALTPEIPTEPYRLEDFNELLDEIGLPHDSPLATINATGWEGLRTRLGMSDSATYEEIKNAFKTAYRSVYDSDDNPGEMIIPITGDGDEVFTPRGSTGGIVPCGKVGTGEMCTLCHLVVGIHNIIKWGLGIMFVIAIVIITIAGIMYIVSAGNESMMQAAKKALMYALVGVAIMLLAWVIVAFVIGMLVGNITGGVNTDNGLKYFSSYSCDGRTSSPPTTTPTPSSTPAPTTTPTLPTP